MYIKGASFVIVLVALALMGGAVGVSQLTTNHLQPTTGPTDSAGQLTSAVVSSRDKSVLADIERQLRFAQKTGGISLTNYKDIDKKLKALEVKKVDTKRVRSLLAKLSVGGQGSKASPTKTGSGVPTLADIEQQIGNMLQFKGIHPSVYAEFDAKLKMFEAKGANTKNARAMLKKIPVGGQETSTVKKTDAREQEEQARVASEPVVWVYQRDQNKWTPSRTPPKCPELVFDSPVDLTKVYAILYPGQMRGNSIKDYKAHGGFLLRTSEIEVRMPFDGYIYQGTRFLQKGVLQYGFDAISECGIMQRFGHLYELSPKFQKLVELLPEPKEMDSRTTVLRPFVFVKKGELIATKIGVPENAGMDWGVMDLRRENEASKDPAFREAHAFQRWYDQHGLCWLDYLSPKDQALAKALPGGDGKMGKTSDYCGRPSSRLSVPPEATEEEKHTPTNEEGSEPPLLLKSIGVDLGDFTASTGRAGDFVFTKNRLQFNVLITEFGFTIPSSQSATGASKRNPQPTFLLPLGTKVRSLVDGVVVEMPKLYSGDYSIMVAPSTRSNWRYETEHVINPIVRIGDVVKAGQVIAEVSPHDKDHNSGYGLVEIGILRGGNPPQHLCPFAYLDPSIKDATQKKLQTFYASWEEYRGDQTLHNETAQTVPGCLSLSPISE